MSAISSIKSFGVNAINLTRLLANNVTKLTYRQLLPSVIFLAVAFAVMLPLLGRGYILQYDMVFGPHVYIDWEAIRSGQVTANSIVQLGLLKIAGFILPMDIVQKIILFFILFFSGYLTYRILPVQSVEARILAGLLYQVNPFVYDRFMAGHWLFLIGYSLTPLALLSFIKFFNSPCRRTLIIAALMWTAISIFSPHHLVILGVLWLSMAIFYIKSSKLLFFSFGLLVMVAVLSSWWLLPLLLVPNFTHSFGYEHFYVFATKPDIEHGLWITMLSLQGFWYQGWLSIKDFISWWPIAWMVVMVPVVIGLISSFKREGSTDRKPVFALIVASTVVLLLSAGPAPGLYAINLWLFENIPGLSGMRESQKFLSLLALAYAYLLALGIDFVVKRNTLVVKSLVVSVIAFTMIIMSWPLFYGGQGQLQTKHYPESWKAIHDYLEVKDPDAIVLALPWNIYLKDTFADRLVASPARSYFDSQMLHSQHTRLPGIGADGDERYIDVDKAIMSEDVLLLKETLKRHNIEYVMIIQSRESSSLQWIGKSGITDLIIVDNTTSFYRVINY